jgi:hypothetical protein
VHIQPRQLPKLLLCQRQLARLILGVQNWCPSSPKLVKSGKFGERWDKNAIASIAINQFIYNDFGDY